MKIKAHKKSRHVLGFSLIELLVAFSLISIISGIGFASFASYSQRQIVVQATADLKQTVSVAKFNAVSFVKPSFCESGDLLAYRIRFCHSPATCISSQGDSDYQMTAECSIEGERVILEKELPQQVEVSDVDGGIGDCGTIVFNVLSGIIQGTPCEVNISGNNNTINLKIDQVGHASY